jgi:transcriptional regulator with XRE-family HTH domain
MAKMKIFTEEEANRRYLFSENLRVMLRAKIGNVKKVSKALGVTPHTVNSYSSGRTFPDDRKIQIIADTLGCTVDDLFDDTYAPWKFGEREN